jgi:predicted N-acetyltransferase YhbS
MILIRPLKAKDLEAVKKFADLSIGENYYSLEELNDILARSEKNKIMCSFVLVENNQVVGFRLSYPPGNWNKGKGQKLRADLWKIPIEEVGYFQSMFLSDHLQGQGWGPKLSEAAISALKEAGAKAIVTHSWVESPHGSSGKYLRKIGFQSVALHQEYWKEIDYVCSRDGTPCLCTAEEMILRL